MKKTIPLLSLIFILLLAACGSPAPEPTVNPSDVADSVSATLTAVGPAPTAQMAPTALPSPTPVVPTLEPIEGDPATILGEPDGVDTFDTAANWTLFNNRCFRSEITDGQFVMESKGQEGVACWEVSWPNLQNFYMQTEVTTPEQCQPDDRFGMLFRAPDNFRGYLYGLTCDGRYSLTKWDGEETTVLVAPATNGAINSGPGSVNRIGVVAFGGNYLLYANGIFLTEVQDFSYTTNGKIGYFVRASSDQGFVVKYDNLAVWVLDDQYHPPTDPTPPNTGVVPTPQPGVATVTSITYVNVRSGPGLQYPIYIVAPPGASAEALGITSDGSWYAIKIPAEIASSGSGWVSATYVAPANTENLPILSLPPLPPNVVPPPPEAEVPTVTTTDVLSVRNGPSNQCESYGKTPVGATAEAVGVSADGGWYQVLLPVDASPDGTGWLNANYLTTSNAENLPVTTSPYCP